MKLLLPIFIFLILGITGCDNGGGDDIFNSGNSNGTTVSAPPTGTGNGPSSSTVSFTPANGTLTVNTADPDEVISVTGVPSGGTISLSNINGGGTGGTFILGPSANQFTFTCSVAFLGGTATVDVTYTPPAPNFPRTITYTVIVIFTGVPATLTFAPPSPQTVTAGSANLVVTATGSPAGGILSLVNTSAGTTGGTFILGPAADEITFTSSTATVAGTETCDVTYTPNPPDVPITLSYTVNAVLAGSFSTGPTAIPNNAATGITNSPLVVPLDAPITQVRVRIDISWAFISELDAAIISPSATTLTLFGAFGGPSTVADLEVIFDDTAVGIPTGSAPIVGFPSFLASGGSLDSTFLGESSAGTWILRITDVAFFGDPGTINEWALAINGDTSIF